MALTKAQLIDLNANELILDLDADTSLHSSTDDQIDIKIGGADDFTFTAGNFNVLTGSHATFADSANAKFGTGSDMLVYHDGSNSYITNAVGALKIATETSGIALTIGHTTSEVTIADNLTVTGTLTLGSGAELTEAELELLDGLTAGTAIATKVVTTDGSIDTSGQRNLTITGELDAATGDFSGAVDVAGAFSLAGTAITSTAAEINFIDGGATVGTTAVANGDGIIHNDGGTMKVTSATTFKTYFQEGISQAYDDFTVGDAAVTVSTSSGNITVDSIAGAVSIDGHTGVTIASSNSGDITLDSVADINIDAGGADIVLKDGGTQFGKITNASTHITIYDGTTLNTTMAGANITFAGTVASGAITSSGIVTGTGFTAGSAVLAEAELELLDGLTAGTAIASKVVTTDGSIDTTGQRNLTITGELDAANLDISGSSDLAGALVLHGLFTQDGGAVFNEASADVQFRIETDDITHQFYVLANKIGIGDSAPEAANNVTINQGSSDDSILSLKSSDVAHGVTDIAETDTYGTFAKAVAGEGILDIQGFGSSYKGLQLHGTIVNIDGNYATGGVAAVMIDGHAKSGTAQATLGANKSILAVRDNETSRFFFDSDGDFHADSSSTTFDAYDDAQLVRTFDLSRGKDTIDSKFDKFIAYNHEHLAELQLVGRERDGTPNNFVNVTGMQRLHNGAIWQQYEKHNQLLEAVYDLAKVAVGEEKANAILDKHEVKRLN